MVDQSEALRLLSSVEGRRRSDGQATFDAIVKALVCWMDWSTGAATVTAAQLGAQAAAALGRPRPFSHDTVGRALGECIAAGVLAVPEGLGGKSKRALRCRFNQAATYVAVEPVAALDEAGIAEVCAALEARLDAAAAEPGISAERTAAGSAGDGEDAYPPRSLWDLGLGLEDSYSLYKDVDLRRDKRPDQTNPRAVPRTPTERRAVAERLRRRLLIGVVPGWRLSAMLARHFVAGLSEADIFHMVVQRPDGRAHRPLPCGDVERAAALARSGIPGRTEVDMLLGMIGGRLALWAGHPGPGLAQPGTPVWRAVEPPAPAPVLSEVGLAWRAAAHAAAASARHGRRAARGGDSESLGSPSLVGGPRQRGQVVAELR